MLRRLAKEQVSSLGNGVIMMEEDEQDEAIRAASRKLQEMEGEVNKIRR